MGWASSTRLGRLVFLWAIIFRCYDIAVVRDGSAMADSLDAVVEISAITGGEATLPCPTHLPNPKDVLLLVVWYKNGRPIYSYDTRLQGEAAHWADQRMVGRLQWHQATPSSLQIHNVIPDDRALYSCRVDFKISSTENHIVHLDVIEIPNKPKIYDEKDMELKAMGIVLAGPYVEDSSMRLSCVVSGGKPRPRLRWWRNEQVVSTLPPINDESWISLLELEIPKLTRQFHEAVYFCTADNTILAPPQRVQVQIQMYLRPLFVEILTNEQPLLVDQKAELTCRAVGSRPPALITWWLDNVPISATQKETDNLNETLSVLRWTPHMEHNGKRLICRATHEKLEQQTIETSITLNLHYAPVAEVQFGSNINPRDIKEGDDVYFECIVQAYPRVYKIVWEHNGQILTHNKQSGIIIGKMHIALQKAKRDMAGKYSCTASNVEGDGSSPPIFLSIIYKPTCKKKGVIIVGAAVNQPSKITCEVDAYPKPKDDEWQWTVNNSLGTIQVTADKFTTADGRSILSYTPLSNGDYGTVNCRARNIAGQQVEPCRYTVLPAVRPDPLANCSTYNLTDNSVELKCVPGYNGSLHTIYFVEAWESGYLILNLSNPLPVWRLRGLGSGKSLKLVFYAYNARGRSKEVVMKVHTPTQVTLHNESRTPSVDLTKFWILGVFLGIAGTLLLIVIIALTVRKIQRPPIQYAAPVQVVRSNKRSNNTENRSPLPSDDKNPDLVPLGQELGSTSDVNLPPEPPPYKVISTPNSGFSRSAHSLHRENRSAAISPVSPCSVVQSIGIYSNDWRSIGGTLRRGREIVTTRTPLFGNEQESCV